MGMDIIGINSTSEVGKCFCNNIWWWPMLWNYCQEVAPDIIGDELHKDGQTNDGAELDAKGAISLAARLREHIASGHSSDFEGAWRTEQMLAPDVACISCDGSGKLSSSQEVDPSADNQGYCPPETEDVPPPYSELPAGTGVGVAINDFLDKCMSDRSPQAEYLNETCGFCNGTGVNPHPIKRFSFSTANVAKFAAFLEDCGGFVIW